MIQRKFSFKNYDQRNFSLSAVIGINWPIYGKEEVTTKLLVVSNISLNFDHEFFCVQFPVKNLKIKKWEEEKLIFSQY